MAMFPALTDELPPILIGKPWSQTFNYAPGGVTADLTGYSAELKIVSTNAVGATTIVTLTSGGGNITLAATDPNISAAITDAATTALTPARAYAYLTLTDGASVETGVLEGPIQIKYWGV